MKHTMAYFKVVRPHFVASPLKSSSAESVSHRLSLIDVVVTGNSWPLANVKVDMATKLRLEPERRNDNRELPRRRECCARRHGWHTSDDDSGDTFGFIHDVPQDDAPNGPVSAQHNDRPTPSQTICQNSHGTAVSGDDSEESSHPNLIPVDCDQERRQARKGHTNIGVASTWFRTLPRATLAWISSHFAIPVRRLSAFHTVSSKLPEAVTHSSISTCALQSSRSSEAPDTCIGRRTDANAGAEATAPQGKIDAPVTDKVAAAAVIRHFAIMSRAKAVTTIAVLLALLGLLTVSVTAPETLDRAVHLLRSLTTNSRQRLVADDQFPPLDDRVIFKSDVKPRQLDVWPYVGPYAPYPGTKPWKDAAGSATKKHLELPPGCEIDQVNVVSRGRIASQRRLDQGLTRSL